MISKARYKVGDIVRVKDREWYDKNKNSEGDVIRIIPRFLQEEAKYCGKIAKIISVEYCEDFFYPKNKIPVYYIDLDNCRVSWSEDAFEIFTEEKIDNPKTLTVYNSTEVQSFEKLETILSAKDTGIEIDRIVYQTWEDILNANDIIVYMSGGIDYSDEFNRIAELCWNFVEKKYNFKDE